MIWYLIIWFHESIQFFSIYSIFICTFGVYTQHLESILMILCESNQMISQIPATFIDYGLWLKQEQESYAAWILTRYLSPDFFKSLLHRNNNKYQRKLIPMVTFWTTDCGHVFLIVVRIFLIPGCHFRCTTPLLGWSQS